MSLPPPYVRLKSAADPLPQPEKDYLRLSVSDGAGDAPGAANEPVTFAVHKRIARQCRVLDSVLDELDLMDADSTGLEGLVTIPDASVDACVAAFDYLESSSTRIPSVLSRPLRAPLNELVQPWEMKFLLEQCLENGDPKRHQRLLRIMKVSDFLMAEPLKDLCCAFLASLVLQCQSEAELLQLVGLARAPTAEEMEPLFEQYPFLRGNTH